MTQGTSPTGVRGQDVAGDRHRPRYHFLPPANWMNDPNGLIQWKGRYHLFYQYNPNGPFHGTIHWGHAVSDDLVRWRDLPIALAPTPGGPDQDGVYSGCAVDRDGVPTLVYTGIRPEVQCIATAADAGDPDLVAWRKHPASPVIGAHPEGLEVEGFRDPFVWREPDGWCCAVGSGIKGVGGTIFLYRSQDLVRWEYLHELCTGSVDQTGRMWECPNFLPLGGKHVLVISPIPLRKVLYLVGTYADRRFTPEAVGVVDEGGSYYAPQVMRDAQGRWLMWGWLREARSEDGSRAAGWSGAMSVPTVLSLAADGALALRPVPELEALRGAHRRRAEVDLAPTGADPLADVRGDRLEIVAELEPGDAAQVGLRLGCSPGGEEETRVVYDRAAGEVRIDRERASLDPATVRDVRGSAVRLRPDGSLKLQLFLDGSVLEVFANDRICLSSRIYPTRADSRGLGLFASGGRARLRAVDVWEMGSGWAGAERPAPIPRARRG
ncbi:MAG TPA: glycoside hydrolase family 32 protein [Chloroflexota bacterium]|jgi:beta-fructofuranosidase|nr:glycoside hydrolase family 32 protein [Chloroflexota bacterium]